MPLSRSALRAFSVALLILPITVAASAQSVADLTQRADKGDAKAMFDLGAHYAAGDAVPQDYKKAAEWWSKAADHGNADAQFSLGALYESGSSVRQDYGKAAALYRSGAEQGHAEAEYSLGSLYYEGLGVPKDRAQAAVWFRKAAEQGDVDAEFYLGLSYDTGLGVPQDSTQAALWYRKAADKNDAKAQHGLGLLYGTGRGVPKDYVEAYFWLDIAAAGELETADQRTEVAKARDLIEKVLTPADVSQVQERARKWFETRAQVSDSSAKIESQVEVDPKAPTKLGSQPQNVQQADDSSEQRATERPSEISETLWEAANKGDAEAVRTIGYMYDSGKGVPQNRAEALRWFRMAASKGDDWSMNKIGSMYDQGLGVSENQAEALRWRLMAADKGNALAMAMLGLMYSSGLGVPQNNEEGYFWSSLSASVALSDFVSSNDPRSTLEKGRKARDEAAATLSPAKVADVRERTQKWIETHPKIH